MLNMPTRLDKLIQEHEVIQASTRSISSLTDNLATLSNLQEEPTELSQFQINYLSDKRVNLKRALGSLMEGLIDHFNHEEEAIEPLVGEPLMRAIRKTHRDMLERITDIDWIMLNIGPQGILFNSDYLKQKIDALCQLLNDSCLRENSILDLLRY